VIGARQAAPRVRRWMGLVRAVDQFVFPRACAACDGPMDDSDGGLVCGRCWARLPLLPAPQCERCGHPRRRPGRCSGCALLPPYVRAARSVCWVPDEVSSGIVGALKYRGWPATADAMGARMARLSFPDDVRCERTALVPIPLAPVRLRERGFNQAECLATAVGRRWQLPVWSVVTRERATVTQTRLTPGERLANVRHAFSVGAADDLRVRGRHLILVDDVLTTGATLNACAEALFAAGARTLSYLTFGRARTIADL